MTDNTVDLAICKLVESAPDQGLVILALSIRNHQ
jgi:hypothetical protein